jgi:small basic protein
MKTTTIITLSLTTLFSFVISYFNHLVIDNVYQYLAITLVIFADGFFGMWAGIKREGFKTYKAIKVIKTFVFWVILLSIVLSIQKGFHGVDWLSSTILPPFLIFQIISILKNASKVDLIPNNLVTKYLDKIDKHKDVIEEQISEHIKELEKE